MSGIFLGKAEKFYDSWERPTTIISDGAYGIGGFEGDPKKVEDLVEWYRPHIESWSRLATPKTSLWFWNTEIGWATVHPILVENGWEYVQTVVWDKGKSHIAGNVNSNTIRKLPTVTEISAFYVRPSEITIGQRKVSSKNWLREEWLRTGLKLHEANTACGVKNAASRKYLTADKEWYMPSEENFHKLVEYANKYGNDEGKPYFSLPHMNQNEKATWNELRYVWNHQHGLTNVWSERSVHGKDRIKSVSGKTLHTNQKPLKLMQRQIRLSSNEGDTIWEPFGGTCTASLAALIENRSYFAAECKKEFFSAAKNRLGLFNPNDYMEEEEEETENSEEKYPENEQKSLF